jgi:hypothetical protein
MPTYPLVTGEYNYFWSTYMRTRTTVQSHIYRVCLYRHHRGDRRRRGSCPGLGRYHRGRGGSRTFPVRLRVRVLRILPWCGGTHGDHLQPPGCVVGCLWNRRILSWQLRGLVSSLVPGGGVLRRRGVRLRDACVGGAPRRRLRNRGERARA